MQPRLFPIVRSDFVRLIARRFAPHRMLLVGGDVGQFVEHWHEEKVKTTLCQSLAELKALPQNGNGPSFDLAIWFYPPDAESANDNPILQRLSTLVDHLILIPGAGADVAKRRPRLVLPLAALGFLPDYDCEVV
ncbi:MAG: hypothetical protein ABI540_03990 [Spartobacteria bacterium]